MVDQSILHALDHEHSKSALLLWRAVHLKRENDGQLRCDKSGIDHGSRHFFECFDRAQGVAVSHHWLSASAIPTVNFDVSDPLQQLTAVDIRAACARELVAHDIRVV